MATIAENLKSIADSKAAIKTAIQGKGVAVSDSDAFSTYSGKINSIKVGGTVPQDFADFLSGTATSLSDPNATKIAEKMLMSYTTLESITFPNVTELGTNSVRSCTALKSFSMNSLKTLGIYAFNSDTALTAAQLPAAETIGAMVFSGCTALTQVDIGSHISNMAGNVFSGCTALTTINVNRSDKAIPYSPWGAPSTCTVNWTGTI